MSIIVVKNPVAGKEYIHPFVPDKVQWSDIKLGMEKWNSVNVADPDAIYVDCEDNASVAELGDMVNMIKSIIRYFGKLLGALPYDHSFDTATEEVYWLSTSNLVDVKKICIKSSKKGKVGDAYTYFTDKNKALLLANVIKIAFEYYGVDAQVSFDE